MRLPPEAFVTSSCELAKPLPIFLAIYSATNGQPCPGCGYEPTCTAKHVLFKTHVKPPLQEPTETVREMAGRLGISLSEARRRRRAA